jgi:hypothetical protein
MLYCLGNNYKKKCLYKLSSDVIFPNILYLRLTESEDMESWDREG